MLCVNAERASNANDLVLAGVSDLAAYERGSVASWQCAWSAQ